MLFFGGPVGFISKTYHMNPTGRKNIVITRPPYNSELRIK